MILEIYTLIHVAISLVGIFTGFVVLYGLLTSKSLPGWTNVFLVTTALTSVTGFFFPVHRLLPSHIVGMISLVLLATAIYALFGRRLAGLWRKIYVVSGVLALYLNVFVGIVQSFEKIPALKDMAPTQSEPPFKITQLIVLLLFIGFAIVGSIRFRAEAIPQSPS